MSISTKNRIFPTSLSEIPGAHRQFLSAPATVEGGAALLRKTCPDEVVEAILSTCGDDAVVAMYKTFQDNLESAIRKLIAEETMEEPVSIGAKVSFKWQSDKTVEGVVEKVTRFDENTFGQGWYSYNVRDESGKEYYLYASEFDYCEEEKEASHEDR